MQRRHTRSLVCFLAACAAALRAATAGAAPSPNPVPPPQPSSSIPACQNPVSIGEMSLCSNEFTANLKTGDVQFPRELHGRTQDGTYRADRGYGNLHSQIINLIGHVVIHRDATHDSTGKPVAAMTLTSDQAHIESKAKYYRASGNVHIAQGDMTLAAPLAVDDEAHRMLTASGGVTMTKGDKVLTAPQVVLDESTHVATLTGGVHAEEKPDKSFDAAEVIYNTATEDFKALGGVRMQFPAAQAVHSPTPAPARGNRTRSSASPAPASPAPASPAPTSPSPPAPSPSPAPSPHAT